MEYLRKLRTCRCSACARRCDLGPKMREPLDLSVGTKVRFVECHTPTGVQPDSVGTVVRVEPRSTPWQPRVRVRVSDYLSGWIWQNVLVRA